MCKKTLKIEGIKEKINAMINAEGSTQDGRIALSALLASILHEANAYKGFNYVGWLDGGGCERWREDCAKQGKKLDTTPYLGDQTRVRYY